MNRPPELVLQKRADQTELFLSSETIRSVVHSTMLRVMGVDQVPDDMPMMNDGVDSIAAVEFRNRVSSDFPQITIPAVSMFDHPTI